MSKSDFYMENFNDRSVLAIALDVAQRAKGSYGDSIEHQEMDMKLLHEILATWIDTPESRPDIEKAFDIKVKELVACALAMALLDNHKNFTL